MSLATAESCTGGALAAMIVDQAGASRWYRGGWVVYTNDMKQSCLGVEGSVLTTHGAVSAEAVEAMAQAAALRSGADYAVAVSGIAGPDGGTKDKPVGTIWIAAHGPEGTLARAFRMGQDRGRIRARSAQMALQLVRWLGSGHGNTPTSWDAP
jgi:PncC family amidohydrolase